MCVIGGAFLRQRSFADFRRSSIGAQCAQQVDDVGDCGAAAVGTLLPLEEDLKGASSVAHF